MWKNVRYLRLHDQGILLGRSASASTFAFWTTHEITYLNSSEVNLRQVNNYITDFYFSEPNFEYVKEIAFHKQIFWNLI